MIVMLMMVCFTFCRRDISYHGWAFIPEWTGLPFQALGIFEWIPDLKGLWFMLYLIHFFLWVLLCSFLQVQESPQTSLADHFNNVFTTRGIYCWIMSKCLMWEHLLFVAVPCRVSFSTVAVRAYFASSRTGQWLFKSHWVEPWETQAFVVPWDSVRLLNPRKLDA